MFATCQQRFHCGGLLYTSSDGCRWRCRGTGGCRWRCRGTGGCGGGAEALEAAGGGAGWRTLVPTAEACLFRTYVLKMAMLVLGLASALTRYLMRAWAFLLWSSYTSFMDRPWKSPNSTIKQPWSPVARASACISCFLSYFSTSSAISLI